MAGFAHDLAAGGLDRGGAIAGQILAEGVIGGDEEPFLAAGLRHRLAEGVAELISVVGPVDENRASISRP